jgi:hypothetical protein
MTKQNEKKGAAIPSAQTKDDEILASLLENLPASEDLEVDVPSKERFYTLLDPTKKIQISPLTFEDEKSLMSNRNPDVDILNGLLSKCVKNVNVPDLLQIDKLYLIMKIREHSYGEQYSASINCPACRKDNNVKFSLAQLNVNYVDDDFQDPSDVFLPILKKTIKVRLPRISDEKYLQNTEFTTNNLWRFVEEVEGITKKPIIAKVIAQLPLQDAHTVLSALAGKGYGIDTNVRFACNYCSHTQVLELPVGGDFFTGN